MGSRHSEALVLSQTHLPQWPAANMRESRIGENNCRIGGNKCRIGGQRLGKPGEPSLRPCPVDTFLLQSQVLTEAAGYEVVE